MPNRPLELYEVYGTPPRLEVERFFKIAREECLKTSEHSGFRHGAVIVGRQGHMVAKGHNNLELAGHPIFVFLYSKIFPKRAIHAEVAALLKLFPGSPSEIWRDSLGKVRGARIYSLRLTKTGELASSRPCVGICFPLLKRLGARDVIYIEKQNGVPRVAHEFF